MKIIYWVGQLRTGKDDLDLKALKVSNPTHEKLYSLGTLSYNMNKEAILSSRLSSRNGE